jgi:hypothetical protein
MLVLRGKQEQRGLPLGLPELLTSENEPPLFRIRPPKRETAERMCGHPAGVCREPSANSSGRANPSQAEARAGPGRGFVMRIGAV